MKQALEAIAVVATFAALAAYLTALGIAVREVWKRPPPEPGIVDIHPTPRSAFIAAFIALGCVAATFLAWLPLELFY